MDLYRIRPGNVGVGTLPAMPEVHTISINRHGLLTSYPMLRSEASPYGRHHVADQFAVVRDDGSRRYLRPNVHMNRSGSYPAADLDKGDVVEVSGKANRLTTPPESKDPEPLYGVILDKTPTAVRLQIVDSLEAARSASQEVLSGRAPTVVQESSRTL